MVLVRVYVPDLILDALLLLDLVLILVLGLSTPDAGTVWYGKSSEKHRI